MSVGSRRVLFDCVLERLCGAELRRAGRIDVNRLARAGIAALACRARLGRKDAEACDRYFVTAFQAGNNRIDHRLDGALGVGLRRAEDAVHLVYDICFIHEYLLAGNPRGLYGAGMGESIGNTPFCAMGLYKMRG